MAFLAIIFTVSVSPFYGRSIHGVPFATVEVEEISGSQPAEVLNLGMFTHFSSMCHLQLKLVPMKCSALRTVIGFGVITED